MATIDIFITTADYQFRFFEFLRDTDFLLRRAVFSRYYAIRRLMAFFSYYLLLADFLHIRLIEISFLSHYITYTIIYTLRHIDSQRFSEVFFSQSLILMSLLEESYHDSAIWSALPEAFRRHYLYAVIDGLLPLLLITSPRSCSFAVILLRRP